MNTKKFVLATIAGFVANVVAYFILEQLVFKGYMQNSFYDAIGASVEGSPVLPLIAVLVMVLIMAYLYPKGFEGGSPVAEGLRFGLMFGLFLGVPFSLFTGAMFSLNIAVMLVLILITILELMAVGVAVGLVYGEMKSSK